MPLHLILVSLGIVLHVAFAYSDFYCGDATCYEVLNVTSDASAADIKQSYKVLSLRFHPDKTSDPHAGALHAQADVAAQGSSERYLQVRQAYDTLENAERRAEYDLILRHPERHYENYARYYSRNLKTNVWVVVSGLLCVSSLCDWLYRRHQYFQYQRFVRLQPRVLERLKQYRLAHPEAATLPDTAIALEDLGVDFSSPYQSLPA